MKKNIVFILTLFFLGGCSAADMKMIQEEIAKGAKNINVKKPTSNGYRSVNSRKPANHHIAVVSNKLPECRGITLHKAFVDHHPMYFKGSVITTIPVYKVVITNKGKRRKVTFDIYYKQDFGNRKYGTKQPTGHYLKEFGPVTLRANTINKMVSLEKPKGREVYERVELVSCE